MSFGPHFLIIIFIQQIAKKLKGFKRKMVNLDELKAEIQTIGDRIKTLKGTVPGDKDAISEAVSALLNAKQLYADHNNGIGVDGQPFTGGSSSSKKEKKKSSAAAAVDAEANTSTSTTKQEEDPNSKGAQKKAAKKAAAAAKRAELKQQGVSTDTPAEIETSPTTSKSEVMNGNTNTVKEPVQKTITTPMPSKVANIVGTAVAASTSIIPLPNHILINPNVPLRERPIVAVAVAVLTNTIQDYHLISDHKVARPIMGISATASAFNINTTPYITGDFAMARYILQQQVKDQRNNKHGCLIPSDVETSATIDTWIDYVSSLLLLPQEQRYSAIVLTLEHMFSSTLQTYVVGHTLSLADLVVFTGLDFVTQAVDLRVCLDQYVPQEAIHARRWIQMMANHPALQEATQLCIGIAGNIECIFDETNIMEPLVPGMNALEGAVAGRVVTRFPPEPSGYLHIGHAKAVLLNDYYAKHYKGRLIVRFDDTNPSKEKEEYQESIVQDLAKLGVLPNLVTYTSDYFDTCIGYAKYMIQNGYAYMDNTPQEQMKIERNDRKNSIHRDQSPEDGLKYFDLMCSGSDEGSVWCLRAKISMESDNGTLRDPVLFRQNLTPHHRSGTKYKAYPTYDLACPIVDSIEGVTHALRTTEYDDRNAQYQWIQKTLRLRRVRVHTFSRVNFKYTVLSKRKLTWFVDNGHVTGWDDARFPTIRGVVRRGINITALRNFMYSQGSSKRVVLMDWTVFWSENKKEIDKAAKRFMAINEKGSHATLHISNVPAESAYAYVETSCHPKDITLGNRSLRIANNVLLETIDVEGLAVNEDIVLMRWGVVKITKVDHDNNHFEGQYIPDGDFKATKRKLSWLADVSNNISVTLMEFDNLISKDKLEEDENFEDFINANTLASTNVIGDPGMKVLQENDIIQLERRGFYRVDRPYISDSKPLILYMIPDGKSKSMSGQTGKLAHR